MKRKPHKNRGSAGSKTRALGTFLGLIALSSSAVLPACADTSPTMHDGVATEDPGQMSVVLHPAADRRQVHRISQEIRPTESNPHLGIGYADAMVEFYDSPGGDFRVWWATEGRHQTLLADSDPANGVPDYVEQVAQTADQVGQKLEEEGWRRSRPDDSIAVNHGVGGNGRFDIYLVDFGGGSDGLVARNACSEDGASTTCTAHMLIENDFAGYGYPSIAEAVSVLVSHEYFHAVQAAYVHELPSWFSEGTATWFQEYFNPDQGDFERLASLYLREPERSLNSRGGGPFDGFAYGVSLFFYYLDLAYGDMVNRRLLETMSKGGGPIEAIEQVLRDEHSTNLSEAFAQFVGWNYFTGARAVSDEGYPQAAQWQEVETREFDGRAGLNWDVQVRPLSAQYAEVQLDGPTRFEMRPIEGADIQPSLLIMESPLTIQRLEAGASLEVQDTRSVALAVVHAGAEENSAGRVAIRKIDPAEVQPQDPIDGSVDDNGEMAMPPALLDSGGEGCSQPSWKKPFNGFGFALLGVLLMALIYPRRYR